MRFLSTQKLTDEDLFARNTALPHRLADLLLIFVHPRSIDVPTTSSLVSVKTSTPEAGCMRTYSRSSTRRGRQAPRRRSGRLRDRDAASSGPTYGPCQRAVHERQHRKCGTVAVLQSSMRGWWPSRTSTEWPLWPTCSYIYQFQRKKGADASDWAVGESMTCIMTPYEAISVFPLSGVCFALHHVGSGTTNVKLQRRNSGRIDTSTRIYAQNSTGNVDQG